MCLQMVQLIQENNEADYANTTDKLDETGSSVLSMWFTKAKESGNLGIMLY